MDELVTYFWDSTHWQWWAITMVLFAAEILLPSFFLLWPAAAALIVGILVFFFPDMAWQLQIVIFTVLSIIAMVIGRKYFAFKKTDTDKPNLNQRGKDFIGRKITLDQDIHDGSGRLSMGDTSWLVRVKDGSSPVKGARVEVVDVDGSTLVVKVIS